MKKDELIKLYKSIEASDGFKERIFSSCLTRKIRIDSRKPGTPYRMITAAAVFAVIIGMGTALSLKYKEPITPLEGISETADNITSSAAEANKNELEEYQRKAEEMRKKEEELRMMRIREEELRQKEEALIQQTTQADTDSEEFIWPCPTVPHITDGYGERSLDGEDGAADFHKGIDIAAPDCEGEAIEASASGTVLTASDTGDGYGICVVIDHGNDITTLYGHMSKCCVNVGDKVEQGQTIGYIGSTGYAYSAHCHFEVRIGSDPVDPMEYAEMPDGKKPFLMYNF